MKRLMSVLSVCLLSLILALPASAAASGISVYVDGNNLPFPAGKPYMQNGSVMVPFRAIFERVGMQVQFDSSTGVITGTGAGLPVKLKLGSLRATVGSVTKKLTAAPSLKDGTVYVPLRFVGEATGGTVQWDVQSQTASIQTFPGRAKAEADIAALLERMNALYNEEDTAGIGHLFAQDSRLRGSELNFAASFAKYDIVNALEDISVLGITPGSADAPAAATVLTLETAKRTGGQYVPDFEDSYFYELVMENGQWKISDISLQQSLVVLNPSELKPAAVPAADAAAIKDVLARLYAGLNAKDAEALSQLMTSGGEEHTEQLKHAYEQAFLQETGTYSAGASLVFHFAEGQAAVYLEETYTDKAAGEPYTHGALYLLEKSAQGAWTITDSYDL